MADDRKKTSGKDAGGAWPNEGEGSRSGARAYDEATEKFAKSGKVAEKAREARQAVDGPEGKDLERAEAEGKRHGKGEDPALNQKGSKGKPQT
jgi:hypothetical protein